MSELKLDLPNSKENKSPTWMDYAEFMAHKEWYDILEKEWWETCGLGYKKTGIVTENSKRKEALLSASSNPKKDIILVRDTEPIQLGESEVKSVLLDKHGFPIITFGPKS